MLTATALLAKTGFRNRTHIAKTPAPALNAAFPRALSLTAEYGLQPEETQL